MPKIKESLEKEIERPEVIDKPKKELSEAKLAQLKMMRERKAKVDEIKRQEKKLNMEAKENERKLKLYTEKLETIKSKMPPQKPAIEESSESESNSSDDEIVVIRKRKKDLPKEPKVKAIQQKPLKVKEKYIPPPKEEEPTMRLV